MRLKDRFALNCSPAAPAGRSVRQLLRQGPQAHPQLRRSSRQPHVTDAASDHSPPQRRSQGLATCRPRPDGTAAQLKSP
jgi:hypothetical protein